MRAEETRIGNKLENGYVITIQYRDGVWGCLVSKSIFSSGHDWEFVKQSDLRPIPLTEDWLIRFGVVEEHTQERPHSYRYKNRIIKKRKDKFFDYASGVELTYVHTLQNFFFAHNEELTISLSQEKS